MDDAVAKALHAARHHLAGGGFLSDLFSGPDYLSTGEVASPTNWGDPESAADFFKADRALRLAREASEPARDMPLPLRRPAPEAAPRQQVASPPPAPAPAARRIETLPGDTVEPHYFPPALERTISPYEFGQAVSGQQVTTQMLPHFQERPGFGQVLLNNKTNWADAQPEVPTSNPQKYTLPDAAFALPAPQAEISRAVSLAQNLAPQQEAIPNAADALAAVEKLHNAGVYSGEALDKAGEILAAHNRAKFDNIPVDDALRLSRAEGPRMVNQGMPVTGGTTRDNVPLAYAETPAPAPASQAISEAMPAGGKMTARIPDEPHGTALTKQQADYVIRTIAAETSGKSPEETQAIASVILNRINSGKYGATPEAVLFAKRQFEPWMNPAGANYPMKISPKSQRYSDARDALEAAMAGEDITRGATNFWGPKSQYSLGRDTPDWAIKMPDYTDIGATRFHRPNKRAEGGLVDDALHVVREHHADGEAVGPTMQQRLRETIASIDPERAQDQPVMDPATMGEAWNRARQNYQNFPVQEGDAVARPLELGARDVIGGAIGGDPRAPGADFRRGLADMLVGNTGLPNSGTLGVGVADLPMVTGIPLTLADMAHDIGQGDYASTAMGAALPAAFYARGPLGAAGRRAVEIAKDYAKPIAGAAGVAATMTPEDAEAAKLSKLLRQTGPALIKKDPAAAAANLSKYNLLGKEASTNVGDLEYKYSAKNDLVPWREITPEDIYKQNGYVTSALGDKSPAGRMLHEINGVPLVEGKASKPVNQQGGGEFGRSTEDPNAPWASRASAVKGMHTKINKAIREQGIPEDAPIFMSHTIMGNPSVDSTQMMAQSMLRQIEPLRSKISRSEAEKFDDFVGSKLPGWPGILNPQEAEAFMAADKTGTRAGLLVKAFDKAGPQQSGFPNLGAARFANMEPRLVSADQLSSGFSLGKLDRNFQGPINRIDSDVHETYNMPFRGEYAGGMKYQVPAEYMFPNWWKALKPLDKNDIPVTMTGKQQTMLLQQPVQRADQQWLDNIMRYLETNKRKWGYYRGGITW